MNTRTKTAKKISVMKVTGARRVSPLNVRSDVSVQERIALFTGKIKKIDDLYLKLVFVDGGVSKTHKALWHKKLREAVKNEFKYLAAEGTAEGGKKPKLRNTTFQSRMSLYRSAIIDASDFVSPSFRSTLDSAIDGGFFEKDNIARVKALAKISSYKKLYANLRVLLMDEADSFTSSEYSILKKAGKEARHPVLGMLVLEDRVKNIIKKNSKKSQIEKHTTGVRVISINLYMTWMHRVLANCHDHDWKNLAIALVLATGRRPVELFHTGKFEKVSNNEALFSGQVKTRQMARRPFVIPLLHDFDDVERAIRKVRAELNIPKNSSNNDVNHRTAKHLSDRHQQIFGDDCIEVYGLRAAYARYCVKNFYSQSKGTEEIYLSSILGHKDDDVMTVQFYKTVMFSEDLSVSEANKRWDLIAAQESKKTSGIDEKTIARIMKFEGKFTGASARIYDFIVDHVKNGGSSLTQSFIGKNGGFNRTTIKSVLRELGLTEVNPKLGRPKEFKSI
jgi:Telomere resolvase